MGARASIWAVLIGFWFHGAAAEMRVDVPDLPDPMPPGFCVTPFENRSGVSGLNWLSAGAPFALGEKVEQTALLSPSYGPFVVPAGQPKPYTDRELADFARGVGATYCFTGSITRPNWELQLSIGLWQIDLESASSAKLIGEVTRRGSFSDTHKLLGEAAQELLQKAGLVLGDKEKAALAWAPSKDFYAFTLLGRGISALLGTEGAVDMERAVKNISRATFIDPKMTEAQRLLAWLYTSQGELKKADGRLTYALSLRPNYQPAVVETGRIAAELGQQERAISAFVAALWMRPGDVEARFLLGKSLWQHGDVSAAYRQLAKVSDLHPNDIRVRRILVLIHSARGEQRDLVRELEEVARLDPGDMQVQVDLAAAYYAGDRLDDARKVYQKIAEEKHGLYGSYKFLGDVYGKQKNWAAAEKSYVAATESRPEDPRAYFRLSDLFYGQKRDADARRILLSASTRFAGLLPQIWTELGRIAFREGDFGGARLLYGRAALRRPHDASTHYNLAVVMSSQGDGLGARTEVDLGLHLEPDNIDLWYLRGVVMARQNDWAAAKIAFEKVLSLAPSHVPAKHNLEESERRLALATPVPTVPPTTTAPVAPPASVPAAKSPAAGAPAKSRALAPAPTGTAKLGSPPLKPSGQAATAKPPAPAAPAKSRAPASAGTAKPPALTAPAKPRAPTPTPPAPVKPPAPAVPAP